MSGTMESALTKAGFKLSEEESKKVKNSLNSMKKKFRRATCRDCGADIQFVKVDNRTIPHDIDGNPHWQSCPYSSFTQRKSAVSIMRKLSVLFVVKLGLEIEKEAGLTTKEAQIVHAVLEDAFKEPRVKTSKDPGEVIDNNTEEDAKADLEKVEEGAEKTETTEVKGDDPIGDPDEDLAPSEKLIEESETTEGKSEEASV